MNEEFEKEVLALNKRLQQVHNGDFVTLLTQGAGWTVKSCFTGIRAHCKTPREALDEFANALTEAR